MAHNDVSVDGFKKLLAFVAGLSAEVRATLPDEDSDDWFAAASEMMAKATEVAGDKPESSGPRTRNAVHYTVLLLREDGSYEVLGADFGPVGREPLDPKKHSGAKKLETRGQIRVIRDAQKGIASGVMKCETSELPDFIRTAVQAPASEPSTIESASA